MEKKITYWILISEIVNWDMEILLIINNDPLEWTLSRMKFLTRIPITPFLGKGKLRTIATDVKPA